LVCQPSKRSFKVSASSWEWLFSSLFEGEDVSKEFLEKLRIKLAPFSWKVLGENFAYNKARMPTHGHFP
jgi:hypothetical protein